MGSVLYTLERVVLDVIATFHGDQAKLHAEVLALRRQVQVLERQIKRARWTPGDRMVLAALRERVPRSAWVALLVKPEMVLGWHRELVRRRWAAYGGRPRRGRPPISDVDYHTELDSFVSQLPVEISGNQPLIVENGMVRPSDRHGHGVRFRKESVSDHLIVSSTASS